MQLVINLMLKSFFLDEVKVIMTIVDFRLKAKLTANKTIRFTEKSSFYTKLGFTQSHSGPLGDIEGIVHSISGSHKSNEPVNSFGIDKIHLKPDCNSRFIVNGVREPLLYSFHLDKPPGHKLFKEPRIRIFEKIKNLFLSQITFYLEDDDYKPVDFNGETISFTCQLIKL